MTPAEAAALLAEAGILTVTARHGERVEYRVTVGAESLLSPPEAVPTPHWSVVRDRPELEDEPPLPHLWLLEPGQK